MAAPVIVTIRPGVAFEPSAAASWRRMEAKAGRLIDVNSSYRDYNLQMKLYLDYQRYLAGGPWAPYALHPDSSMHCKGLAADTDDQKLLKSMPDHGWRQTALAINEPWHFDYFKKYDKHIGEPANVPSATRRDRNMILLKGQDSQSGTTTVLVLASKGIWDRYAISFEAALAKQFGPALALNRSQMAEKEATYKA